MANHFRAGVLVFVCFSAPIVASAQSAYSDDFEATTVNAFWTSTMQQNGTVALSTDQNYTSSGIRSIKFASASGGQREMHLTHTFSAPTKGTFSVWYYDYAPGQQTLY